MLTLEGEYNPEDFFFHGRGGTFIKAPYDMRGILLKWCDQESIVAFKKVQVAKKIKYT